jgi:DnaK suppressor protein
MTDPIAETLRHELTTTLRRLQQLDIRRDEPAGVRNGVADLFDSAQAVEQRELGHLTATRLTDRARRLRAALDRLDRGEYGICEECGKRIGRGRLAAIPDVATCVGCQERRERSPAV